MKQIRLRRRAAAAVAAAVIAGAVIVTSGTAGASSAAVDIPCALEGQAFSCTLPAPQTVTATETATATATETATVTETSTVAGPTVTSTVAGPTVTAPPVTVTSTVTAASSTPVTSPIGPWSAAPIFTDDFATTKPAGFGTPSNNDPKWTGYHFALGSTGNDSSKRGYYRAEQGQVRNGYLDITVQTIDGKPRVWAPIPKVNGNNSWPHNGQLYGRYAMAIRTDNLPRYKIAALLWPDSGDWAEGEIDFPEGDFDGNIGGFSHNTTGNPSANCMIAPTTTRFDSGWHEAVIEWKPGSLQYFLDGVMVGSTTAANCVPTKPMHYVLQVETSIGGAAPNPATAGSVRIDNVRIWDYVG